MYAPWTVADTIYGCAIPRKTARRRRRSSCRRTRSRAPSPARWATCGIQPACRSAPPRASSARRRPSYAAWRTPATSHRCDRWPVSRRCTGTSSASSSRSAAWRRRRARRRRRPRPRSTGPRRASAL